MNNKERMLRELIYDPTGPDIMTDQIKCLSLLYKFNKTKPTQLKKRNKLLKRMFGSIGEGCYIEPPLRANWGGKHVFFGNKVYANFNLTLVDDGNIYVGDCTKFGPNVTVATPNHPFLPELRDKMYQYNKDIHIGKTVWIGSNVTIVPGVTIGDNSVIGAGSVVTKDIPDGVIAYGVPAKVIRKIDEHDREFFYKNEKIDWDNLK